MRGTVRGYRLQAPQMLFALRRRVVQCPQGAEVSRGSETLRAASLVWDVEQGRLTCSGMVSGARRGVSFVGQDAVLDERTRTLRVARARFTLQPDQFQDFEGWHP
jgi:hypothetical protein